METENGSNAGSGLVEPPNYYTDKHIFDFCFHPEKDFIAMSNIEGVCKM